MQRTGGGWRIIWHMAPVDLEMRRSERDGRIFMLFSSNFCFFEQGGKYLHGLKRKHRQFTAQASRLKTK